MALTLKGLTFDRAPRIPGVRPGDLTTLDCENPAAVLVGWSIIVRGTALYFVSPPGWTTQYATMPTLRDPNGPVHIHEVPRSDVFLHWQGEAADVEAVLKGAKFETGPMGPKAPPAPPEETRLSFMRVPPSQMGDA